MEPNAAFASAHCFICTKKRESYLILHPRWFSVVIWKGMRKSPLVLSLVVHGLWHNLWGRNEICLHVEFTPCSCTRRLAVRPVILPCVYLLFLTASSLDSLPPRQGLKYFFSNINYFNTRGYSQFSTKNISNLSLKCRITRLCSNESLLSLRFGNRRKISRSLFQFTSYLSLDR